METRVVTLAEIKAYKLMTQREMLTTDIDVLRIHEEADNLILLAEKIKAERAINSMQNSFS